MDKKGVSQDYIKLRKLFSTGYSPIEVNIEINNDQENVTITLLSPDQKKEFFKSSQSDVVVFAFSIKSMSDIYGDFKMGEIKDLTKYFDTLREFYDPENKKLQKARKDILDNKVSIDYVPHNLIKRFLEEGVTTSSKSFLKLRDDYYVIRCLHIEELKMVHDGLTRIRNQKSVKTEIFDLTLDLFRRAFHQDTNFLKNYQLFQKYNLADVMELLVSTNEDLKHFDHQFKLLHKEGGVPAKFGLRHVIEGYSTMAETIIKLINVVRAAIEIVDGHPNPDLKKGSVENWTIIKQHPMYSKIVEDFDPRIRHGKAHNNFEIDLDQKVINFYSEGRIRKIIVTYSIEEIRIMWHRVHILVSALVMAVCVEQSTLTSVVLYCCL
jgi:hypothetical protein